MKPIEVTKGIYLVGDARLTDPKDCTVYLIDAGGELILIDAGAGTSVDRIVSNIAGFGLDASRLSALILTHCHIDHIGGAAEIRRRFGVKIVMHTLDAAPVKAADRRMTGADWYGVPLAPLPVDVELMAEKESLRIGDQEIVCLHTPGHTPGSISVYLDRDGERTLFGQDIHGPFLPEFGSSMDQWRQSMASLLALDADILCEGHFGVFRPKDKVAAYIERYLEEYGE